MSEQRKILERIARKSGVPNLFETLSDKLSGSDLKSLMLQVYSARVRRQTLPAVLRQFETDALVRPSPTNPLDLLEIDSLAFSIAQAVFEPVELSPVCPLGTISALTKLHQDRVVTTIRNTEVVSDSTNVLVLECASRRRLTCKEVRLCASHRLLRPSVDLKPGDLAHFRIFGLCSATRRGDGLDVELQEIMIHVRCLLALLVVLDRGRGAKVRVTSSDFSSRWLGPLGDYLGARLAEEFPEVDFALDPAREHGRGYYPNLCFHVNVELGGQMYFVADGGFVDWTQQLLGDRHERLLISGIGTERLCGIYRHR